MQPIQLMNIEMPMTEPSVPPRQLACRKAGQDMPGSSPRDGASNAQEGAKQADPAQGGPKQGGKAREEKAPVAADATQGRRGRKNRGVQEENAALVGTVQSQTLDLSGISSEKPFASLVRKLAGSQDRGDAKRQQGRTALTETADKLGRTAPATNLGSGLAAAITKAAEPRQAGKVAANVQGQAVAAGQTQAAKAVSEDNKGNPRSSRGRAEPRAESAALTGTARAGEGAVQGRNAGTSPGARLGAEASQLAKTAASPAPAGDSRPRPQPTQNQAQVMEKPEEGAPARGKGDGLKGRRVPDQRGATTALASAIEAAAQQGRDQTPAPPAAPMARMAEMPTKASDGQVPVVPVPSSPAPESAPPADAGQGRLAQAVSREGEMPVVDQVIESIRASGERASRQITVQLSPPELGRVRITFREDGDELVGTLEVANVRALRQLEREGQALAARLEESGVPLRRIEFVLVPQGDGQQHGAENPLLQGGGGGRQPFGSGGQEGSGPGDRADSAGPAEARAAGGLAPAPEGSTINVQI